ncbi:MAG TPA: Gfo/Idh/MocA family oxidoreductase [Anaerolineaceae bacterium]|jgi:predicted dehydrogenase
MAIGIGILGFAHGHVNAYCTEWQQDPRHDIKVVAGWDDDPARLESARQNFKLNACTSAEELLARPDVDAVVITSETSKHLRLVELAAAAGKPIALQKPMTLTLSEADQMVACIQRTGVPFTLAWQMRVDPQNIWMKEKIHSGELGKIFMVRRRHGLGTHTWPNFNQAWHVNPALNRDIWADDAAHAIDFIHWLLGKPGSVTAELESLLDPKIPMDNGIALYHYPGGPIAEVSCSFTCVAAENTTEVIAEKGTIIQNYGDVPSCNVPRPEGAVGLKWFSTETNLWIDSGIPSPDNHGKRIAGLAGPLAEFFHGRREPIGTVEEGYTTLKMVLACYVSTQQGRRVSLDENFYHLG